MYKININEPSIATTKSYSFSKSSVYVCKKQIAPYNIINYTSIFELQIYQTHTNSQYLLAQTVRLSAFYFTAKLLTI